MARFYGNVGFVETVENVPGVHAPVATEFPYYGNVERNSLKMENGESARLDLRVSNSISILADAHALRHFSKIRYVMWEGVRWTVSDIEIRRPRLILLLGEVYDGPTP